MNGFVAFFKKEWLEAIRTKRLFILLIVFSILGILSPLTALLTPLIIEKSFPEGVFLQLPDPTAIDSWASFFNNISQMGTIVLLLLFGGILANDVKKHALIPLLTKGLSRKHVILAKLAMSYILWTIAYFISFVIAFSYTLYYWDMSLVSNLTLAIVGVWLCGIFLITLLMLFSTLFLSFTGALLGTAATIGVLLILPIVEATNRFNPLQLFGKATILLTSATVTNTYWQIGSTVMMTLLFIIVSIFIFNKKQL